MKLTSERERLINFLKDDMFVLIEAIESNEQMQGIIYGSNGKTLQDLADYWRIHLQQI